MKTLFFNRFFLMLTSVTLIVASCTKEPEFVSGGTSGPDPEGPTVGVIKNMGQVEGNNYLLDFTLKNQPISLTMSEESVFETKSEVHFNFLSADYREIPTGDYNFSASDNDAPFTFGSAKLLTVTLESSTLSDLLISSGVVHLYNSGSFYIVIFDCVLQDGGAVSGYYSGDTSLEGF